MNSIVSSCLLKHSTALLKRQQLQRPILFTLLITLFFAITFSHPYSTTAHAALLDGKVNSKGELSLGSRAFKNDNNRATIDQALTVIGKLELSYKQKPFKAKLRFFGRSDHEDNDRSAVVLEEAWLQYKRGKLKIRGGIDVLNWSATEAFHPADVINSRDLDSDFENLGKLGEPMLSIAYKIGHGRLTTLYLPYVVNPIFPSSSSRLNPLPGNPLPSSLYLGRDGHLLNNRFANQGALHFAHQGALRFTQSIGSADMSLHLLHQIDREQPFVVFDFSPQHLTWLPQLVYAAVNQVGGTYQQALGAFVLKVEIAYRKFVRPAENFTLKFGSTPNRDHLRVAAGLEYVISHDSSADSTFFMEGQSYFGEISWLKNGVHVGDLSRSQRQALSLFQRDLLLGYRYAANDIDNKSLTAIALLDLDALSLNHLVLTNNEQQIMFVVAYEQRLNDQWTTNVSGRLIYAPSNTNSSPSLQGLVPLDQADSIQASITRHF